MQNVKRWTARLALMSLLVLPAACRSESDEARETEGEETAVEETAGEETAGQGEEATTGSRPAADPTVERALVLARALRANPDDPEAVLAEHGMTVEELESLMYRIAASPELSASYEASLR